jgi:DNA adenine methylase
MLASIVGKELRGCKWVGVPFAGGMSELAHIKCSTLVVSDLHRDVINLAHVVAFDATREKLIDVLTKQPFHPEVLKQAQQRCSSGTFADEDERGNLTDDDRVYWAAAYFTCCWMGRSAKAGTDDEFKGGLPVRWSATGGDSNTRYRSAIESLDAWGEIMRKCNFVVMDVFDFLDTVKDLEGHGLYLDPPFPGPGDDYKFKFTAEQHRKLAARLREFKNVRIVCRFYDHELIRELYPEQIRVTIYLVHHTNCGIPHSAQDLS